MTLPRITFGRVLVVGLLVGGLGLGVALVYRLGSVCRDSMPRVHRETIALQWALTAYTEKYGHYPTGDNAAISRALTGENPQRIVFIDWFDRRKSPAGELLDPWGTPYRFYFAQDGVLIRSAGENRLFEAGRAAGGDDWISE